MNKNITFTIIINIRSMNKSLLILSLIVVLFAYKSSSKTIKLSSKSDRTLQSGIKGNWKITKVSYPASDYIMVNSFQVADSKCFIGSTWNFIPNSNNGNLNLNQSGKCSSFSSPIVWSIDKNGNFGLKIVEADVKSKIITQGFELKIANKTDNSFQLVDVINVGGQDKKITYQFEKLN